MIHFHADFGHFSISLSNKRNKNADAKQLKTDSLEMTQIFDITITIFLLVPY